MKKRLLLVALAVALACAGVVVAHGAGYTLDTCYDIGFSPVACDSSNMSQGQSYYISGAAFPLTLTTGSGTITNTGALNGEGDCMWVDSDGDQLAGSVGDFNNDVCTASVTEAGAWGMKFTNWSFNAMVSASCDFEDLSAGIVQTYTVPTIPVSTIDASGLMTGGITVVGMLFGLVGVFIAFFAGRALLGWALNTAKRLIKGR